MNKINEYTMMMDNVNISIELKNSLLKIPERYNSKDDNGDEHNKSIFAKSDKKRLKLVKLIENICKIFK